MKSIVAVLVVSVLLVGCTAGCVSKPTPQPIPTPAVIPSTHVEQLVVPPKPTVEYTCIDVWNAKLQKKERKCRYIEIHKPKKGL